VESRGQGLKFVITWQGIVAVILACGVVCGIFLVGYYKVGPEEAGTLATVLGASVGAIATFLGSEAKKHKDDGTDQT
jgi:hypothetical protein